MGVGAVRGVGQAGSHLPGAGGIRRALGGELAAVLGPL